MKKKRTYHGWIFTEKSRGFKDYFSVQWRNEAGQSLSKAFEYGERAAAAAVDFFETTQKLGRVKLESTPLGLRVYTETPEEEEGKSDGGSLKAD